MADKVDKPILPKVAYPLKMKSSSSKYQLQHYIERLVNDPDSRFLFNDSGLWHQGIHICENKFKGLCETKEIRAIADGRLLAYKVDSEYKQDKATDKNGNEIEGAIYSTGFFLLEHEMEFPKGNKLTFYSLYRHTAKIGDYADARIFTTRKNGNTSPQITVLESGKNIAIDEGMVIAINSAEEKDGKYNVLFCRDKGNNTLKPRGESWYILPEFFMGNYQTKSKDNNIIIKQHEGKATTTVTTLTNGIAVEVIPQEVDKGRHQLLSYTDKTTGEKKMPPAGAVWSIFKKSYVNIPLVKTIPLLTKNHCFTELDKEVIPEKTHDDNKNTLFVTKSADKKLISIKDETGKLVKQLPDGLMIAIKQDWKSVAYADKNKHRNKVLYYIQHGEKKEPTNGAIWTIFENSYIKGGVTVKAGEVLGFMGEYNHAQESGNKLFQLEVFTYDDIESFRKNAQKAYDIDKKSGSRQIKDNLLVVSTGSQLYTESNNAMISLKKAPQTIIIPLSEVNSKMVGNKKYFDISPYVYGTLILESLEKPPLYVDDSNLTHGVLLPNCKIFKQSSIDRIRGC